jgi:hypothetical protein
MKNVSVNMPLKQFQCEECNRYFSSTTHKAARICPECQNDAHLERARETARAKHDAIRRERPLKGFLRVVCCADSDDLVLNGDVPEDSIKISIQNGYFSSQLKMINFKGNVVDCTGKEEPNKNK